MLRAHRYDWMAAVGAALLLVSCAGQTRRPLLFSEPTSDQSFIVIGNVLVESRYFEERPEVYRSNIEVAIVAQTEVGGKAKTTGYWTTTDEEGYFVLTDVPPGKYAIKGIRFTTNQGTLLTITNTLRYAGSTYVIDRQETVIFDASYFPVEARGRVVNLGYNLFTLDQMSRSTGRVDHVSLPRLVDRRLVTGETLNLGDVESYVMAKHPQSAWVEILKQSGRR
ncbi:MAG: hypothetical protein ONB23_08690 [candidate division KSB1 bacterium]|nr:hypothetical protein [candidate division KSB1 bacterium]